jgi:putative cell wall-binding protein
VTTIGYAAFYRCTTLASISVDPENAAYTSDDSGALFDKAKTELIKFPPKNPQASYVIPEGVISIGYSAFQSCTTLTSIIIPSGVTSIESSTFSNCIALTSINIPSGVTSIGREAFSYCTSLTSITIPSGLTSIGDAAFYYCTSLASIAIPYGVTTIEGSTFSGCIALTSITIPSGVVSIGGAAFQNCSLLTSIAVPDSMTTIESYAFAHCTSLTSINIPSDVASIGGFAFYNCASLTSIVIPASTTTIGYAAFYRCTSLASISVNPDNASYTSDDSGALFDKAKTKLIKFPPASPQESYTIPASVTSIGDASIEDASIIGDAFFDCPSLASISVDPGNAVYSSDGYGVLFNKAKTELIKFPPASSQESYVISADVASIRDYAFRGCSFLASILVDPGNAVYSSDGYGVLFNKAKTELIQFPPASPHGNYVIPEGVTSIKCIRGKGGVPDSADYLQGQTTVGNSAFSGCPSLTSVVIPSSMTGIDDSAFAGCTSLVSVSIPTSVTMISIYAFANCISLASVTIPTSVTMILTGAFIGCKGPIYCEAPVKPDGWYLWDLGYDGQVFWGQRAPGPDGTVPVAQHDGIDRMATAVKASQKAYPDPSKVDVVVLAYAYDFPDALAASYLAGALGAPILLTDSGALDAITEEEIRRLAPSTVYLVGGTGSVSDTVAGAVGAYPSVSSVTRLGGEGREETAYLIACEAAARRGAPSTAFVADAKNFPDALSAGSLAASQGAPILLTGTGTLDFWAQRFLEESAIGDIVVVGGPGSVPAQVEEQLRSLSHGPAVTRWSGTDRYETSADALNKGIAKWGINPTVIGLASGDDFPDALVGGAAIGGRGGLLAITDPDELSVAAVSLINTYKGAINGVEIFGGPGTIRVQGAVQTLLG